VVEKIKKQNLLKIPNIILKRVGLMAGDYVEVADDGYRIIITPKSTEETFTDEEWGKLAKLAKSKKGKAFRSSEALMKHLDKLSKK